MTDDSEGDGVTNEDLLEEIRGVTPSPLPDENGDTHTHRDETTSEETETSDATGNSSEKTNSKGTQEKPHRKSARHEKVRWLADQFTTGGKTAIEKLESHVKEHYGFRDDIATGYAWEVAAELSPEKNEVPDDCIRPEVSDHGAWYMKKTFGRPSSESFKTLTFVIVNTHTEAELRNVLDRREADSEGDESSGKGSTNDESEELDFGGVDIDGSESFGEESDADELLGELEEAERGRKTEAEAEAEGGDEDLSHLPEFMRDRRGR